MLSFSRRYDYYYIYSTPIAPPSIASLPLGFLALTPARSSCRDRQVVGLQDCYRCKEV
ncbi:MAG: hypothetical protein AB4290_27940 [Spirulina sp.]